ncbi:MAG: hypothetical protein LBD42_04515 [Desulfovibrio sp.]|jgi:hypothetical protein|nr:hypothetical protein [Desulfovibrio sp.]
MNWELVDKARIRFRKEQARLVSEYRVAGYDDEQAATFAALQAIQARAFADRYGMDAAKLLRERRIQREQAGEGGTQWQLNQDGNAVSPGEQNPRVANVVAVDPAKIVDGDGKPVDLKDTKALAGWLREQYQDVTITIADDGTIQQFTGEGLDASLKRRIGKKRGPRQRQAYAELDTLLENALFDGFEQADERHKDKVAGQNVYYSAARIGGNYFSVRFKVDMPLGKGINPAYKDHKVTEIEIAPSLYRGPSENIATQPESAIRGISLSVLKGDVKPSRIEDGTLYQGLDLSPEENASMGLDAMNRVIAEQTDVLDAMYRPEVGGISFYWGTPGKGKKFKGGSGVAHIIEKRNAQGQEGEAVARKMAEVIAYGEIGPAYGPPNWVRRNVTHDGHTAVLSLYKWDNQETWLFTGWEDNESAPSQQAEVHVSGLPTGQGPILNRPKAAGASSGNTIPPSGADGKTLFQGAKVTDSPAFKKWFGDSKVVDEDGRPLVVYHGTYAGDIDAFDPSRMREGAYGKGFYFAESPEKALLYGDVVYPVYLRAERNNRDAKRTGLPKDHIHDAKNGIWVVSDPTQIKSVFNRGAFNPKDPRILYQGGDKARDYGRRVKEAAGKWVKAVKKFVSGKMRPEEMITLGETPDILTGLKQDALPRLPLVLTQEIARKATGQIAKKADSAHSLTESDLSELPYRLAEPVAVLKEAGGNTVIVTDLMLKDGSPVIVAVRPDAVQGNIAVNDIRTAFGKGGFAGWFEGRVKAGELRYLDKTKSATLGEHIPGHQLPSVIAAQRSSGQKITWDNEVVKPDFSEGQILNGPGPSGPRGAVSFNDNGQSLIRIFESANLSTPIHESAHVFVNDLIRVVMDNGRTAGRLFMADLALFQNKAIAGGMDEKRLAAGQTALRNRHERHKAGIIQARKDLTALVENANAQRIAHGRAIGMDLPEVDLEAALDGTLSPEQMRTLQEVSAVSFEDYIKTGRAPGDELKGVFARMAAWLTDVYRAVREAAGARVTDEVATVFDRMLTPDAEDDEDSSPTP